MTTKQLANTSNKNVDLVKLLDLRAKGLTYQQIADLLGISKAGVHYHIRKHKTHLAGLDTFKKVETDLYRLKIKDMVTALTAEKIKKMAGRDLVTCIGIMIDKVRLIEGETTENIGFAGLMELSGDLNQQAQAIQARISELKQLQVTNPDYN